jgi:hypothetical protein
MMEELHGQWCGGSSDGGAGYGCIDLCLPALLTAETVTERWSV